MPQGWKYSNTKRAWVREETERKIDYGGIELYDVDSWGLLVSYWRAMPDRLLDLMEAENPLYYLEIVQRILIRIFFHYQHAFVTASRGFTKSFCCFLAKMLIGVLYPATIMRYAAPTKEQMASIASEKWQAICQQYPVLAAHWEVVTNSSDRFEIKTAYGSSITISVERGNDCHSITAEEVAQEESGKAFDFERFANAVLPTARVPRMVNKERDPNFPHFQKNYITSAGNQQNASFEYRNDTFAEMLEGKNSICLDFPATVACLSGIREVEYYQDLRKKQTPEAQLREIDSIWTGSSENPVIRDSVLTESKTLMYMENRHCGDKDVIYVIGYDVSYAEGARNAKCATAVCKLEKQSGKDKFLKSFVYIADNPPPRDSMIQARQLKDRWYRFCLDGGRGTYIAIDANSYGRSVLEDLHKDLGDGLPPLCTIDHELADIELPNAIPCIYPIRATGGTSVGHGDSDGEMIKYAEMEFEHRNVQLLVSNLHSGIKAYKLLHRIKDDSVDNQIAVPYIKTREMCGQIANLRKKASGSSIREERISKAIQRDMWSATKYALWLSHLIEYKELVESVKQENRWTKFLSGKGGKMPHSTSGTKSRIGFVRKGGNQL